MVSFHPDHEFEETPSERDLGTEWLTSHIRFNIGNRVWWESNYIVFTKAKSDRDDPRQFIERPENLLVSEDESRKGSEIDLSLLRK